MQANIAEAPGGVGSNNIAPHLLGSIILFLMSLFDFYKSGLRIFEMLAYAVFFSVLVARPPRIYKRYVMYLPLLAVAVVYFSLGLLSSNNPKTSVGLLLSVSAFVLFSIQNDCVPQRNIKIILGIHLLFFFLQLGAYYLFGQVVKYQQFTDIEPLLESSIFRPAGLFYEPAIYCLAMYMLLLLIDPKESRSNFLEIAAALSMIASFSMWGMVAASVILCRLALIKRFLLYPLGAAVLIVAFVVATVDHPLIGWLQMRLGDIEGDASAVGRYGSMTSFFQSDSVLRIAFGAGFGASFEEYGSNATSYLLSSIGIAGCMGFLASLMIATETKTRLLILLVPIILAAPIFAYGFFPIWLSLLLRVNRVKSLKMRQK